MARRAELVGLVYDEQRQRRSDGVAEDGKEPDQRIKAEAYARPGDDKRGVEQRGKRVDPRDAGVTRGRTRLIEVIGGGHCCSVLRCPAALNGYAGRERKLSKGTGS